MSQISFSCNSLSVSSMHEDRWWFSMPIAWADGSFTGWTNLLFDVSVSVVVRGAAFAAVFWFWFAAIASTDDCPNVAAVIDLNTLTVVELLKGCPTAINCEMRKLVKIEKGNKIKFKIVPPQGGEQQLYLETFSSTASHKNCKYT